MKLSQAISIATIKLVCTARRVVCSIEVKRQSNEMLNFTIARQCLNGELKNNETNNILYICVSGVWRPICSYFWGHTQATVACRQLNPGKTVFSEHNR